ncbi:hypothetical protein TNCT_149531 [Trichonephila clavata]|uniref:Uncharacterized protein n=1 Tax=Trichonephila clavata TaxID=2740835 RepID=A0A8X6G503_TRICU|nr:hypothetical protein TNCT_149531 [Trichonephila clavata]
MESHAEIIPHDAPLGWARISESIKEHCVILAQFSSPNICTSRPIIKCLLPIKEIERIFRGSSSPRCRGWLREMMESGLCDSSICRFEISPDIISSHRQYTSSLLSCIERY